MMDGMVALPLIWGNGWIECIRNHPEICIAISEYGAGASIYHQQDSLVKTVPTSWWHPENWQTYYHIENWKTISSRPYVWGSFVWNMFDFGAHIALKETVPELMIKVWLPSTGKFVKMLSTSIRPTGIGKNNALFNRQT